MPVLLRRLLPIFFLILLLPACAPRVTAIPTGTVPATYTPTPPPTIAMTPPPTHTPTPPPTVQPTTPPPSVVAITQTPGLVVSGYVLLQDGTGLAGVTICRNFASYNGTVVATTDADGFFRSDFAFVPGDEMVGVWPLAPGYTFDPPSYSWRHYFGLEERPLDFVASPGSTTATPPAPCS